MAVVLLGKKGSGKLFVMLVCPREILQNQCLHNDGTNMQGNSWTTVGRLLRVAASFNNLLQPTVSQLRCLPSAELARS